MHCSALCCVLMAVTSRPLTAVLERSAPSRKFDPPQFCLPVELNKKSVIMILKFRTVFTELILREIKAEINSKPVEIRTAVQCCVLMAVTSRTLTAVLERSAPSESLR